MKKVVKNYKSRTEFLQAVDKTIRHLMKSGEVSLQRVSQELELDPQALRRRISAYAGMTGIEYLLQCRLSRAKMLLAKNEMVNICEVGKAVGYDEATHFTRAFKHVYGITPREYRLELRKNIISKNN